MTASQRTLVSQKYKEKIPAPLNTQFPDRVSKSEAVASSKKRKQMQTPLFLQVSLLMYHELLTFAVFLIIFFERYKICCFI